MLAVIYPFRSIYTKVRHVLAEKVLRRWAGEKQHNSGYLHFDDVSRILALNKNEKVNTKPSSILPHFKLNKSETDSPKILYTAALI